MIEYSDKKSIRVNNETWLYIVPIQCSKDVYTVSRLTATSPGRVPISIKKLTSEITGYKVILIELETILLSPDRVAGALGFSILLWFITE